MKNLILGFVAVCSIGFLAGCACDERHDDDRCSASIDDSKDMTPYHHHHHHHVDTDNQ